MTSSRLVNSVQSERGRQKPLRTRVCPRNETPAKQTWTYVYSHDVAGALQRSKFLEQSLFIFHLSSSAILGLATDANHNRQENGNAQHATKRRQSGVTNGQDSTNGVKA
jgi:hypothetical protein